MAKEEEEAEGREDSSARANMTMNGGLNPAIGMVEVEGCDDARRPEERCRCVARRRGRHQETIRRTRRSRKLSEKLRTLSETWTERKIRRKYGRRQRNDRSQSPSTRLKIRESVPPFVQTILRPTGHCNLGQRKHSFSQYCPTPHQIATRSKNLGIEYAS